MKKKKGGTLADKLFPKEPEEYADSILSIPPEQRRLHTETYDFSIATIRDHLKLGTIFVPSFQRGYVWTESQASRLIESLIIQCPIPVIYLSQESDERLSVIDGNQRLTSIQRYLTNEFTLRGLTAYPELEGLRFFELDPRFQRHILNRTLRCIVIMKETHPQVKFDVFERLNTGAVKLSPQELRHGLYHGKFIQWVDKSAKDDEWKALIRAKNDKRMKSEEMIIRFLSLHYDLEHYEKPLAGFLNTFSEKNREATESTLKEFHDVLIRTTQHVKLIFGDGAFKVFEANDPSTVLSEFNTAVFDAQMVAVSRARTRDASITTSTRHRIIKDVAALMANPDFQKAITLATSDVAQIKTRIRLMQELLQKYV